MHRSGAELVRYALEQLNTQQTFGVVGDSNRAIYNELQNLLCPAPGESPTGQPIKPR